MEAFYAAGLLFGPRAEVDRGEALFAPETDGRFCLSESPSFGALPAALDALRRLGGGLWPDLPMR